MLLICSLPVFGSNEPDSFTSAKFSPHLLLPAYHRLGFIATMSQLTSHTTSILGFPTDVDKATILADTNELQTDLVNGGRLDLLIDAIKAKTDTI